MNAQLFGLRKRLHSPIKSQNSKKRRYNAIKSLSPDNVASKESKNLKRKR
jgi:hypothetical protein